MRPLLITLVSLLLLTACATGPQPYIDASHKPTTEQQRDLVECRALAAQSAAGAGQWSRDPAFRQASIANAQEQYLAQCLESRGWKWKMGY